MTKIKKLTLDVLKPDDPSILDLAHTLVSVKGVTTVDITVSEVDKRVETVKIHLSGSDLSFERIDKKIEKFGATVHSIDFVSVSNR